MADCGGVVTGLGRLQVKRAFLQLEQTISHCLTTLAVPALVHITPGDPSAKPALHNGRWVSWLDEPS
jgi:hypothetical protein